MALYLRDARHHYKCDSTHQQTRTLARNHTQKFKAIDSFSRGVLIKGSGKYPITTVPHCLPRDVLARRYERGIEELVLISQYN